MRQIEIPALQFSPWYAWDDRRNVPQGNMPGIYLLSISRKNLAGHTADWSDVSYIGMTNSQQGLLGRWQQFFNSIRGKNGHSGGNTVFRALGPYDNWELQLFVAAMPVECNVTNPTDDDLIKMGWVAYLEYEAFAECCRHSKKRCKPEYNTR
jgi:hypothetical protein